MNIKRIFAATLLLCGTFATLPSAAENADTSAIKLTIDQAIELALSENPTIKIAELEVERYDYVRKTTMGALLPQLSVDGTYHQILKNQSMIEGLTLGDSYATLTATANVSLALYAPAVYRTLKMNATEAEAAVEAARSSRIDLIAAVKNSFYGVLLAERQLEVLLTSSETSKQTADETREKFKNGLSSEYDLLTAEVQHSNLQPTILSTRSAIEIAKDMLKMYLSIPQLVQIEVEGSLDGYQSQIDALTNDLSRDISENSSIRSLTFSKELLQHQLKINNASRMPTLAAYGSLTHTGNNMNFSKEDMFGSSSRSSASTTPASGRNFFWQNPSSVGLSLSIPIFSGLSNSSRSRQIKNQISQLELQQRYTEESISLNVSTAINDIYTARETLSAQQLTMEQASKAYDISLTRYNAGAGTILELNTARLSLTQAELNFSQAIYNLLTAKSEYDRLMGSENIE